jgi:hypothetical protein
MKPHDYGHHFTEAYRAAALPLPGADGQMVMVPPRLKAPAEVVDVAKKRYDIHARELLQSDSGGGTRYRTEVGSLRLPLMSS